MDSIAVLLRQLLAAFPALFTSLWCQRALMHQMIRREVVGRYRGSWLGILWSFINPVLMLSVYTLVFSVVFQARWNTGRADVGTGDKLEFALVLFAGLIVFNIFSECVGRAPGIILSNINYVKKVIFPLEILPWVNLGSALFHAAISLLVLLTGLWIFGFGVPATALFLPLLLLPFFFYIMGLSWFFASIGVFVRDVGQIVSMAMTVLMFLSPIFYPASALPEEIRAWLFLNPATFVIEQTRDMLIWGKAPDWSGLGVYSVFALLVAWLGFFWFQKTRKGFADVL